MNRTATVKRTPFHAFHVAAGGKLIEFAGYEMPVRYTGDVREHRLVREAAGLFDVSHMGEFFLTGPNALRAADRLVTNDVAALEIGQALYSPMCREDGGIVDDVLVYRDTDHVMIVVNAANVAKDAAWIREHLPADVVFEDRSDETALLALQGPRVPEMLASHVPAAVLELGYYRFTHAKLFGAETLISRTGYTGEDGFEIYFHPRHADAVWNGLMDNGRSVGLEPVGLGARDTLRLEMGFMLYGNDIDDTTSPLEAGLGWTVKLGKPGFIGQDTLQQQKASGLRRKLVGFTLEGRRVARHDMVIEAAGRNVGRVTSGTFAPSLERPIGLGYVETPNAAMGGALDIVIGGSRLPATVAKPPFYTHGSRKTG